MSVECQEDGQVLWSEERKLLEYHRSRGVIYPPIQVQKQTPESLSASQTATSGCGAEAGGARKIATMIAFAGGLLLIFYELAVNNSGNPVLRAILSCAFLGLTVVSADRARLSGKDPQSMRGLEHFMSSLLGLLPMPDASTGTSANPSQPVRAIAWHPYLNMFAVALMDANKLDSSEHIAFYDMDAERWLPTVVKHQFQRAITSMQFQPNSGGSIAVACREGICLWHLEPHTTHNLHEQASNTTPPESALSAWMSWYVLCDLLACASFPRHDVQCPMSDMSYFKCRQVASTWQARSKQYLFQSLRTVSSGRLLLQ